MSDKPDNTRRTISQRFVANVLNTDGDAANRARDYRKKILASYIQAELD